jgi:MEDS: MEthanogen/methylotroph, DcmR Sensory domain
MRSSGLPTVGSLSSPTHVLHLYRHGQELLDISAGFCWAGLEEGDYCLWVTAPPWTSMLALTHLTAHHAGAAAYVQRGQMQFIGYEDWHVGPAETVEHPEALLEKASLKLTEAHQRGWARIRLCGNALPSLTAPQWAIRLRYEEALHQLILRSDLLVLCSYRVQGLAQLVKSGLLHTHDTVLSYVDEAWRYVSTAH